MRDLTSFASMKLKAALFVVIGLFSGVLVVFGPEFAAWQRALFLVMCVWAFCRAYYFAFYVIEKYVDPSFRFSGLGMAVKYLLERKQTDTASTSPFTDPPPNAPATGSQRLPIKWWLLLIGMFMIAGAIPWFHLREDVRGIIEPLRYPWGLMPVPWLGLRWLGEGSWYVLCIYAMAGVIAWERPTWGRFVILGAIMIHMTFATLHALYSSKLVTMWIREEVTRQQAIDRTEAPEPVPKQNNKSR